MAFVALNSFQGSTQSQLYVPDCGSQGSSPGASMASTPSLTPCASPYLSPDRVATPTSFHGIPSLALPAARASDLADFILNSGAASETEVTAASTPETGSTPAERKAALEERYGPIAERLEIAYRARKAHMYVARCLSDTNHAQRRKDSSVHCAASREVISESATRHPPLSREDAAALWSRSSETIRYAQSHRREQIFAAAAARRDADERVISSSGQGSSPFQTVNELYLKYPHLATMDASTGERLDQEPVTEGSILEAMIRHSQGRV